MGADPALSAFDAALRSDDTERLYDLAPCGYLSTTPDGVITRANQTFLTLIGHDASALVGKRRFVDLLTPGGRIYHETHYSPMLQMQDSVHEIALELIKADGNRVPVLVNSVLARDSAGAPTVIRTAVFDATERRSYERELLVAKARAESSETRARALTQILQQTLIPPAPPLVPGLEVAARYRPAGDGLEVGGDFYDIFEMQRGDWVIVIGDVCGKGVEAAVVTSFTRFTLRGASVRHDSPAAALADLNAELIRHGSTRYCTVAMARLRERAGHWDATTACAGHPLPLLLRATGDLSEAGRVGTLLGIFDDVQLHDVQVRLNPGDALVLYTDGVTEARRDDDFYGTERLHDSVRRHLGGAEFLAEGLVGDAMEFQSGLPGDDIAVVAVMVPAAQPSRPPADRHR